MSLNLNHLGEHKSEDKPKEELAPKAEAPTHAEPKDDGAVNYTSHPIMRLKIGRFQFDRGLLVLTDSKDVAEFDKLHDQLPERDKNQIRKIDTKAAERLVRPIEPGMTKTFDSSVGRQREVAATGDKVIGDEPLEGAGIEKFAKLAQTDANKPVDGSADQHVVNEKNQGDVDTANKA